MDISQPEITYALLIIPTLIALVVVAQGIVKMAKSQPDGQVAVGFGLFLFLLIGAAYFFFIR